MGRVVGRDVPPVPKLPASVVRAIIFVPLVALAAVASGDYILDLTRGLIYATLLLSLVLLTGYSGQISLAQYVFFGLGAFAMGKVAGGDSILGMGAAALIAVPDRRRHRPPGAPPPGPLPRAGDLRPGPGVARRDLPGHPHLRQGRRRRRPPADLRHQLQRRHAPSPSSAGSCSRWSASACSRSDAGPSGGGWPRCGTARRPAPPSASTCAAPSSPCSRCPPPSPASPAPSTAASASRPGSSTSSRSTTCCCSSSPSSAASPR